MERIANDRDSHEPYPLSQGIRADDLVFISGQCGYGDDGKIV